MSLLQVTYDPSAVSYERLLETFWGSIDPTQQNGQGGDRGSQYRTGIYAHTPEQREAAERSRQKLQEGMKVGVCIRLAPSEAGWLASRVRETCARWARSALRAGPAQEPIATEVEDLRMYSAAEEYHQQYLSKGGRFGDAQDPSKGCSDPVRCYG